MSTRSQLRKVALARSRQSLGWARRKIGIGSPVSLYARASARASGASVAAVLAIDTSAFATQLAWIHLDPCSGSIAHRSTVLHKRGGYFASDRAGKRVGQYIFDICRVLCYG